MGTLYKIVLAQLKTFKKKPINTENIIRIYWLTNMACKIVYIDNHYQIGKDKRLQYLVHLYNTVITSKVVDLENYLAYHNHLTAHNQTSYSFVNSASFDMLTINTIRQVFKSYVSLTGNQIKLVNIPHITINDMSI